MLIKNSKITILVWNIIWCKRGYDMKLHMQILIALGLGIKRNGHIFLGLIAGIILGIAMHAYNAGHEPTAVYNIL